MLSNFSSATQSSMSIDKRNAREASRRIAWKRALDATFKCIMRQSKRRHALPYTDDMQIIELDSFVTAFPVHPGEEAAAKRRFMTLFAQGEEQILVGGTSYVRKVRSFTGETFALKRLLTTGITAKDVQLSGEDSARITKGHAAAFYEEYKSQLLVSHMRGFPKLYGYGQIGDDPVIIMEWVDGVSLRDFARQRVQDGLPITGEIVAQIGAAVLEVLHSIERLDSTLAHRDISPANILIRTSTTRLVDQVASGEFDICLIDFGSASAHTPDDPSFTMASQVWRNGTPAYAPPEMLTQDMPHIDELRKSQAIDVFALCSVLYELYSGRIPWDLGKRPDTSPFRVKTEDAPDPLDAHEAADASLVDAIMAGLAIDQAYRPSVAELLSTFESYLGRQGANSNAGENATSREPRAPLPQRVLPGGLYTPDSTRLKVARVDEGGKRAGENIPAFEKQGGITRRSLIVGGVALAFAAVAGGSVVAHFASKPGFDFSGYAIADSIWDGDPLYPAMQLSEASWHLLDAKSNRRAPLGTDREPGRFSCGLIKVHDAASGGYGFLTASAESSSGGLTSAWSILPTFADADDFSATDELAAVQDAESGLWGYVDIQGNMSIHPAYDETGRFSNGFAAVRPQGSMLWSVIDASGTEQLKPQFARIGMRSEEGLSAALEQSGARWGFIDAEGQWAIPNEFEHVKRFSEGLAACLLDEGAGLWGYLDTTGKTVIEARFAAAYPFSDGLAPAKDPKLQLWGLIDTTGAWRVEPRYLSLGEKAGELFPAHGSPANSYDIEDKSGAWEAYRLQGNGDPFMAYGYIDAEGNWIFKPSYGDTLIRTPEQ